jgi:predicted dehydrogenase
MVQEEQLDVVSVATPNKFHKPLAIAALESGCHVLCEKPMALNAREAREMLAVSQRMGKRIMINFSFRFNEQSLALKQQVDAGVLGDVYFARTVWHRRWGLPPFDRGWFVQKSLSGGGPLIDLGVHRLDLALWLMGHPKPTWVLGSTSNVLASGRAQDAGAVCDVEDLAVGLVKFETGATLVVEASWAGNIRERELMETRLYGTKGGLVQRNTDETYKFEAEVYFSSGGAQFDMRLHPSENPVKNAMVHFVDSIISDTPHLATGEDGVLVMEIVDAIYESARKGQPVLISDTA